jgi:LCP family protein required for cell wall assembly
VLVPLSALLVMVLAGVAALVVVERRLQGNVQRTSVFAGLDPSSRPSSEPTRALDLLVLGSDTRDGVGEQYQGTGEDLVEGERADTTLLVHIAADRDAAWVVSIPRDSWVALPACPGRDGTRLPAREGQINSAFEQGGLACTVRAVERLTGVRIDHTAVVDFSGFKDMVDALDGVPVCLTEPFEPRKADVSLPAGRHLLEGPQALEYVRARYVGDGSDLSRIERQKAFMASMLDKALSRGILVRPDRLVRFLDAATRNLEVDDELDLRELATSLRRIDPAAVTLTTVPLDPAPGPEFEAGGRLAGRVAWDPVAAGALFADLRADRLPRPAEDAAAPPSAVPSAVPDPSAGAGAVPTPGASAGPVQPPGSSAAEVACR